MNDDDPDEPDGVLRGDGVTVAVYDRVERGSTPGLERLAAAAQAVLSEEGIGEGRLDLHFVDEPEMAELNEAHMGHAGPTDVLAFPLDALGLDDALDLSGSDASGGSGEAPGALLGDVVVCPAVAERQAPDHAGSVDAELTLLVVHGVLHVLGHDHAEDDERLVMQGAERRHLQRLGFRHPVPA